MKICGIDPSINSSGKCIMDLDPDTYAIRSIQYYAYNTVKVRSIDQDNVHISHIGSNYAKLNMFDRQDKAYKIIEEDMDDVVYVAFEGYAFGATKSNAIFQIGEFIGGMKKLFYDKGKGVIIYPPTVIKRFATGNGTADKTQMSAMFKEEHPELYSAIFDTLPQNDSPHSDICDAFWITETLRCHIIYEKLGVVALDEGTVALLEYKSGKKSQAITDTKIVKKLV